MWSVTGVKTVLVALMAQKAEVKYDPAYIMPSQIASHVMAIGYEATVLEDEQHGHNTIEVYVGILSYDYYDGYLHSRIT